MSAARNRGAVERTLPDEMMVDVIEDGTTGLRTWRIRLANLARR
jgi:hypothetical protein